MDPSGPRGLTEARSVQAENRPGEPSPGAVNEGPTRGTGGLGDPQPAAFGIEATIRIEAVSSSNWSQGRIQAMALYEPGLPGISVTWTLASRSGNFAFISWPAFSLELT